MQPFGSELVKKNYLINNGFTLEGLPDYYRDFLKDGSEKIKYIIK